MKIDRKKLIRFDDFPKPNSIPFGLAVSLFLERFAEIENYKINGMHVWRAFLATDDDVYLPLYILEETLALHHHHNSPFCNHCKLSGWGHHFVCKTKYHFIIPAKEPLKGNFADITNHRLYGLIHCNGYGHLISVNASKTNFTESDVMEFWNNLCTLLKARKISVCDVLRKGTVEARLIHGVAFGLSWYGGWGYRSTGGHRYDWAIEHLSSLSLVSIAAHFKYKENGKRIKQLIKKYQGLSEKPLVTLRDLLLFMVVFEPRNSADASLELVTKESVMGFDTFVDSMVNNDCRWSAKRLETVLLVIVDSLKERKASTVNGRCCMSRNELREQARNTIGDTGLIDFVLKSIKCFRVDDLVICRGVEPSSRRAEFTVYDIDDGEEAGPIKSPVINYDCRLSQDKLEHATKVVVSILRENRGNRTMGRKEVRDKAKWFIDDTSMIDFVLNIMDSSRVGNQVAHRTKNPITKRIDFAHPENLDISLIMDTFMDMNLHQDVLFLYKNVLLGYPETSSENLATRVILESNHFVKEWPVEGEVVDQFMTLTCKVLPSFDEMETVLTRALSPGAVVLVRPSSTVAELKMIAQCALRNTYCVMDKFVVTQIGGLRAVEDDRVIGSALEPGAHVWVRGSGLDLTTKLRYEDGGKKS